MKNIRKLHILLFMCAAVFAQELPVLGFSDEIPYGFYKTGIRYGETNGDSLYIRWSHTAQADTFWVYKGSASLEYITNANTKTVFYNQPMRYERRMALHHLREYVFNSNFRFSDMEALAKNYDSQLSQFFFVP